MTLKKKKVETSKNSQEELVKSQKELEQAKAQNMALADLMNLKDESYFRQQLLSILLRISNSLEKQTELLENESEEELEDSNDEAPEDEEEAPEEDED